VLGGIDPEHSALVARAIALVEREVHFRSLLL
jgi:hypothetical protein